MDSACTVERHHLHLVSLRPAFPRVDLTCPQAITNSGAERIRASSLGAGGVGRKVAWCGRSCVLLCVSIHQMEALLRLGIGPGNAASFSFCMPRIYSRKLIS